MNSRRSAAAFTLVEAVVGTCLASVIGLIIYGVASESLIAFSRNVSINRSYGEARRTIDRVNNAVDTAGHTPVLIDATGADAPASTSVTNWAGIRFWRSGAKPRYLIPQTTTTSATVTTLSMPNLSGKTISINLYEPSDTYANTATATPSPYKNNPPTAGNLITIALLGFQGQISSVSASSTTATLSFTKNLSTYTSPAITTLPGKMPAGISNIPCVEWTPVAFIVVGTQLRFYPRFINADMALGTSTDINAAANYKVVTNLISNAPSTLTNALLPFSLGPSPSINLDLYAEAPDYNNRKLGSANTYTAVQTAMAPHNPSVIQNP